jgi:hypothetical protein
MNAGGFRIQASATSKATNPTVANTPTAASRSAFEARMAPAAASSQIPNGSSAKGAFRYQTRVRYVG